MLSLAALRHQGRRYLAALAALVLGAAFLTFTASLGTCFQDSARAALDERWGGYDVIVDVTPETTDADLKAVQATGRTRLERSVWGKVGGSLTVAAALPDRGVRLTEGRLPSKPGEVLASPEVQRENSVDVGSRVVFELMTDPDHPKTLTGTVVGIGSVSAVATQGFTKTLLALPEDVQRVADMPGGSYLVQTDRDPDAVAASLRQTLGDRAEVTTVAAATDEALSQTQTGAAALTTMMSAFALLALAVAALVTANTFTVVLAQRARELALLRLVGATGPQVRRSVTAEALVLGLLSGALGLGLGFAVLHALGPLLLGAILGSDETIVLTLPWFALLAPVVLTILASLVAALRPALRASRTAPLAALRDETVAAARAGLPRVRIGIGVVLFALGTAALVMLSAQHQLLLAVLAGFVSFVGLHLVTPLLVRWLVAGGAAVLRRIGPSGELAGNNARSNPSRTAATASALLIGVTLAVMMVTAIATMRATAEQEIVAHYPVDLTVTAQDPMTDATLAQVAAVPGVAHVARGTTIVARQAEPDTYQPTLLAVDPAQVDAFPLPAVRDALAPGRLVLPREQVELLDGVKDGDTVALATDHGKISLKLTAVDANPTHPWLVTAADGARLDSTAHADTLVVDTTDDADGPTVLRQVVDAAHAQQGVTTSGSVLAVADLNKQVRGVQLVVLGLLGTALAIALIGIVNTLSLSVLERRRELGLLRATGFTKAQVRSMICTEGVLMALVAAVIGLGAGVVYGQLGVLAASTDELHVVTAIPWTEAALCLVGACLAGLLAALLPAVRAAGVAPARALAAE